MSDEWYAVSTKVPESSNGIGALVTANRYFLSGDHAAGMQALARSLRHRSRFGRRLGIVFQVPVDGGIDTVAAYDDGTFRYYNAIRGAVMVEPGAEATVNADSKEIVRLGSGLLAQTPAPGSPTISLLTPAATIVACDDSAAGQAISQKALLTLTYAMSLSGRQSVTE